MSERGCQTTRTPELSGWAKSRRFETSRNSTLRKCQRCVAWRVVGREWRSRRATACIAPATLCRHRAASPPAQSQSSEQAQHVRHPLQMGRQLQAGRLLAHWVESMRWSKEKRHPGAEAEFSRRRAAATSLHRWQPYHLGQSRVPRNGRSLTLSKFLLCSSLVAACSSCSSCSSSSSIATARLVSCGIAGIGRDVSRWDRFGCLSRQMPRDGWIRAAGARTDLEREASELVSWVSEEYGPPMTHCDVVPEPRK